MGRKFVFSLEAVLRQREAIEERQQRRVAELERERLAVEERIRGHQAAITSAKQDLRRRLCVDRRAGELDRLGGGVSLRDVRMQANASLHMVARAQQAVLELAGVHRRLDAARLELLKATTERKAVELLRAKRYEEWRAALARKEDAELDEINVTRHARNQEAA